MPRYCANGFLMSLTARYTIIELAHVPMREEASLKTHCVGSLPRLIAQRPRRSACASRMQYSSSGHAIPKRDFADVAKIAFGAVMVQVSNYTYEPSLGSRPGAGKPLLEYADVPAVLAAKLRQIRDERAPEPDRDALRRDDQAAVSTAARTAGSALRFWRESAAPREADRRGGQRRPQAPGDRAAGGGARQRGLPAPAGQGSRPADLPPSDRLGSACPSQDDPDRSGICTDHSRQTPRPT
jgi:hypothetical protein